MPSEVPGQNNRGGEGVAVTARIETNANMDGWEIQAQEGRLEIGRAHDSAGKHAPSHDIRIQ